MEVAIKETITCVLARSILVYIPTPLVAAKRWKQSDVERIEVQLYRLVHALTNYVSNKAVMNVACSIRSAWEVVKPLAQRASLQGHHQEQLPFAVEVKPD